MRGRVYSLQKGVMSISFTALPLSGAHAVQVGVENIREHMAQNQAASDDFNRRKLSLTQQVPALPPRNVFQPSLPAICLFTMLPITASACRQGFGLYFLMWLLHLAPVSSI